VNFEITEYFDDLFLQNFEKTKPHNKKNHSHNSYLCIKIKSASFSEKSQSFLAEAQPRLETVEDKGIFWQRCTLNVLGDLKNYKFILYLPFSNRFEN
jgi:hypothetical protein